MNYPLSVVADLTVSSVGKTFTKKGDDGRVRYSFRSVAGASRLLFGSAAHSDADDLSLVEGVDYLQLPELQLLAFDSEDAEDAAVFHQLGTLKRGQVVRFAFSVEYYLNKNTARWEWRAGRIQSLEILATSSVLAAAAAGR